MRDAERDYITSKVPAEQIFSQLAEECSELAQASLKMARKLNGLNPTPKTLKECYSHLVEEIADVIIVLYILGALEGDTIDKILTTVHYKMLRWVLRLKEAEVKDEK